MFGLVAAALALAVPASGDHLASRIELTVSTGNEYSGLIAIWYEAFVAPDGTIERCTVRAVLGDERAARRVCAEIVGSRAKPAIGIDAKPTYGTYVGAINFADNLDDLPPGVPDMTIQAKGVPNGTARVNLTVTVGVDGKVLACEPNTGSAALTRAACGQLEVTSLPVRRSKAGTAVSYLSPMIVQFELDRG